MKDTADIEQIKLLKQEMVERVRKKAEPPAPAPKRARPNFPAEMPDILARAYTDEYRNYWSPRTEEALRVLMIHYDKTSARKPQHGPSAQSFRKATSLSPKQIAARNAAEKRRSKIVDLIRIGVSRRGDIENSIGVASTTVSRDIAYLLTSGRIKRACHGHYGLAPDEKN